MFCFATKQHNRISPVYIYSHNKYFYLLLFLKCAKNKTMETMCFAVVKHCLGHQLHDTWYGTGKTIRWYGFHENSLMHLIGNDKKKVSCWFGLGMHLENHCMCFSDIFFSQNNNNILLNIHSWKSVLHLGNVQGKSCLFQQNITYSNIKKFEQKCFDIEINSLGSGYNNYHH